MAKGYLMDTNVVIDYLSNRLPEENAKIIDNVFPQISVITRMELLGWPNGSEDQITILKQFIESSKVFNLEEEIIVKTIELFKTNKIKLPDAIIAATALNKNLILMTRNIKDFQNIENIEAINPHQ